MLFRKQQFTDGLTNLKRGYVGFENKHSPGRPVEATAQEKIHELLNSIVTKIYYSNKMDNEKGEITM